MITFTVVRQKHGWAVCAGECMSTPFWSRDLAIREAKGLAEAIRRHGERTEVIVEGADREDSPSTTFGSSMSRLNALLERRRVSTR